MFQFNGLFPISDMNCNKDSENTIGFHHLLFPLSRLIVLLKCHVNLTHYKGFSLCWPLSGLLILSHWMQVCNFKSPTRDNTSGILQIMKMWRRFIGNAASIQSLSPSKSVIFKSVFCLIFPPIPFKTEI